MKFSTKWLLPRPTMASEGTSDSPIDLAQLFHDRDVILDLMAKCDHGPLSSRQVSTVGSPGIQGRFYIVTDQPNSPRLDWDYGTGWMTVVTTAGMQAMDSGTVNLTFAGFGGGTMTNPLTVPHRLGRVPTSIVLTPAQYITMVIQPFVRSTDSASFTAQAVSPSSQSNGPMPFYWVAIG